MKKKALKEDLRVWKMYAENLEKVLIESGKVEIMRDNCYGQTFDKTVIAKDDASFTNCLFKEQFIKHPNNTLYLRSCIHVYEYACNKAFFNSALIFLEDQ